METLSPRERILDTLDRLPVDRCPCDIWCTPEVMTDLERYFGVCGELAVYDALGVDKILFLEAPWKGRAREVSGLCETPWGSWVRPVRNATGGGYEETVRFPLAGVEDAGAARALPLPGVDDFDYGALADSCARAGRWVRMLSFVSLFEIYCKLKPMDEALVDLAVNPETAHVLIDRILRFQLSYIERAAGACASGLDLVYLSDDMGMQDRPLVSMSTWEEYFREPYRTLIDLCHSLGYRTFYHSDGAAFDVLRAMAGLGVDVVNPLQHLCPGMDRQRLKDSLGGLVILHGAVENQRVLPFGSPSDVEAEVREDVRILGRGGGYICAPCHNIQSGTPVENILALYRTARGG